MITVSNKVQELMESYEKKPTDELAHEIVKSLKVSMKADKPRSEIVKQFLQDHCYSFTGPCETYVDNVPGHSYGTFYIDSGIIEQMEIGSAANRIRDFINKNFAN